MLVGGTNKSVLARWCIRCAVRFFVGTRVQQLSRHTHTCMVVFIIYGHRCESPLVLNISCGSPCSALCLSRSDSVISLFIYSKCDMRFISCVFLTVSVFCLQGDSPFGKSDAYIKLEQLGEGSYATVYKGYSK